MPLPQPPHTLLAFDTATERMALAVQTEAGRWLHNAPGGAQASAELLPAAQALLQRAGRRMQDVVAIGFGRGPGAFTGLRTSCAVAQGLAFGLGCPVLPLDSLLLVAEQARREAGAGAGFELAVTMDARMGEIYAGRYRHDAVGGWTVLQPPALWAPDDLARAWGAAPPPRVAGSAVPLFGPALAALWPAAQRLSVGDDRAAALIELADHAWRAGAGVDAAQALPLYVRDKVAQTTAERAAARSAA
ncbi:MAG: tRNA (adenosine(37)-N6)-threonylcarbamoyltransferase complex dimerization subunit type 1 TsaB [Proteobacteria bacterium]|nr:tRNA (adenosine(37)-N6)-threonylcarbamoyltransferase complex dimerization subunit type 1 TsaB [Pseudomonadota bacterium]